MRGGGKDSLRSNLEGKAELVKFLSPLVLKRYGEYMMKHQITEAGEKREGDDWKKSWDQDWWNDTLIDSKIRHILDAWLIHDGYEFEARDDEEEALCAEIFGAMGRLHNILHKKYVEKHKT